LAPILFDMPAVTKHFDSGVKRAAIELWRTKVLQKAKVLQRAIMKKLGTSKATLKRFWPLPRQTLLTWPYCCVKETTYQQFPALRMARAFKKNK
jgi:hypothetical protein